jgi:hypothetical protein
MILPWTNLSITGDQNAINRGVQVGIGTPPQLFSLLPTTADRDIYIANKADCAPSYNDSCVGAYGGVYDYRASSTFLKTTQAQWNGTYEPNPAGLAFVYFNDVFQFGNATAYGFPLFMDQPGYGMLSIVIFKERFSFSC